MTAGAPTPQNARWVAALLISGVGLAGVGYSLATRPTPGPQPVVFVPQQVEPRVSTPIEPAAAPAPAPSSQAQAQPPDRGASISQVDPTNADAGMSIDVNTATAAQLELLPGIGPSRAAAIIESRQTAGPFRTVEDLARVHGIGPATVEGVRPYVRIEPVGGGG